MRLLDALNDSDASVRSKAVPFLTDSGDTEIITTLHRLLKDSSYIVVARALRALSKADPANAKQILIDHLDVPSHRDAIASTALSALSDVDTARGREEALRRVRYGNPQPVRGSAIAILRRLATRGKGDPAHVPPAAQRQERLAENVRDQCDGRLRRRKRSRSTGLASPPIRRTRLQTRPAERHRRSAHV